MLGKVFAHGARRASGDLLRSSQRATGGIPEESRRIPGGLPQVSPQGLPERYRRHPGGYRRPCGGLPKGSWRYVRGIQEGFRRALGEKPEIFLPGDSRRDFGGLPDGYWRAPGGLPAGWMGKSVPGGLPQDSRRPSGELLQGCWRFPEDYRRIPEAAHGPHRGLPERDIRGTPEGSRRVPDGIPENSRRVPRQAAFREGSRRVSSWGRLPQGPKKVPGDLSEGSGGPAEGGSAGGLPNSSRRLPAGLSNNSRRHRVRPTGAHGRLPEASRKAPEGSRRHPQSSNKAPGDTEGFRRASDGLSECPRNAPKAPSSPNGPSQPNPQEEWPRRGWKGEIIEMGAIVGEDVGTPLSPPCGGRA